MISVILNDSITVAVSAVSFQINNFTTPIKKLLTDQGQKL